MIETRRQTLDAMRAGPALFAGLPGDEVDVSRLADHLIRRGIHASIYATDGTLEGVLWIEQGAVGETWFFEVGGPEAVLPITSGRDLLHEIAARGGSVSLYIKTPHPAAVRMVPVAETPVAAPDHQPVSGRSPQPSGPLPTADVPAPAAASSPPPTPVVRDGVALEPPSHPWPEILTEVSSRVARSRGPRLAGLLEAALARALAEHGGRLDGETVVAPALPESTWRQIVEKGCAPIVSIAGRAFLDRMIATAERQILERTGHTGDEA